MQANKQMIGAAALLILVGGGGWWMGRSSKDATASVQPGAFPGQDPMAGPDGEQVTGFGRQGGPPQGAPPQDAYGSNPGAGGGPLADGSRSSGFSQPPGGGGPGGQMPQQRGGDYADAGPQQMGPPPMGQQGAPGSYQQEGPHDGEPGGGGDMYRDPNGQFAIRVPSGWRTASQNGGVVVSRGSSMAMVSPFTGAQSGEQIVSILARQYGSQWQNLQVTDQGRFSINGAPAAYMMMSGTSPRGVQSLLRLAGTVSGGQGYAIIISTPLAEFNSTAPQLQAIEASLAFGSR